MRPSCLFPLFAPVASLKGVGARLAPLIERLAGPRVRDLLFLPPLSVVERPRRAIAACATGEIATFEVEVISHRRPARGGQPWRILTGDESGFLTLAFFKGHGPHLERVHPPGARRLVSGRTERFGSELQIAHPDYLVDVKAAESIPALEAIYPATAGLSSRIIRRLAADAMTRAPELPEWQDAAWVARQHWPAWRQALARLHSPVSPDDASPRSPHRRRLAYDELLAHQLALGARKRAARSTFAPVTSASDVCRRLEAALPFRLTGAQLRALAEIRADLASGHRMHRLVQGDVGAGKTVVAMLAMAEAAAAGGQAALMAPTEILARQHYETLAAPLAAQGLGCTLLTGRDKGSTRREKLAALADGTAAVAVGTHALFQDDVAFRRLRLCVVDEQHRFGVSERSRLQTKGEAVHLLAMSATPIPRTLELTVFGDLDVSRIEEKPAGRLPIITRAVPLTRLPEVVGRLQKAVDARAQAFWICPVVSESDTADIAAAESRAEALRRVLGGGVGLVHGRMPAAEKDGVMAQFVEGRLSVLVATTVVEVGVDAPNATIMVIEQAERFGLAQLHQLRGRVGRGRRQSRCVLLYDPPLGDIARRRLETLRRTEDGFAIAEQDLALRGGGDPLGLKQSGFPAYRLADPAAHADLIAVAADDARLILATDPALVSARGEAIQLLQALFDWPADRDLARAG